MSLDKLDGADLPDAALVMLNTRALNAWLGTSYTLEQVAEMDPMVFEIMASLAQGMNPKKVD